MVQCFHLILLRNRAQWHQVSAIYREPHSYFNVKPKKSDVPTSQCHPVFELIASEMSLIYEDHFTKPRRKKLVGDGTHRPCLWPLNSYQYGRLKNIC